MNVLFLLPSFKGVGESGMPLHYKGTIIHGIIPDHIWFGGDITHGNGLGGESIYGQQFPKEDCIRKHDGPGILSTGTNGSQFMLHMKVSPDYDDGEHIAFGRVLDGLDVMARVGKMVGNEFVYPSTQSGYVRGNVLASLVMARRTLGDT
ncbi:hypothetical protein YC2023_102701 [Brassica napus]